MAMEPNESLNQDRFSAILENQRAIMVNQATILHNQNKIMRGMEQLFAFFPALQSSLPIQNTIPNTVTVAPLPANLGSSDNSRVEQPPVSSATQLPSGAPPPSVSPSPRVENTTPINTPTRPQAPLNSSTPSMVANPVKPLPSSGASSPGSADIVYTVSKFGQQSQAIVKLNCLEGQEYAGHLCADAKSAEKSAAEQALQANFLLVQAQKDQPKRMMSGEDGFLAEKKPRIDPALNPAITPKTELNSLIGKISKKVLQKGETLYVANKIGSLYQATVQSAALPDEWASRAWAGELCPTRQQAEQSAAEQALKDIKEDAELMEKAHRPGKPGGKGQKTSGGGGGGNKGYWGQMMQMMQTFLQEGGEVMFREQVTSDFVTGTVLEWKGKFGWIKPDAPVDHEFSTWRDGKVWVSLKDLSGLEELSEGQRVRFKVYVDPSGLGAEETSLV